MMKFFAHLRQNFKPHYSIISINQKLNWIKKRSIILIKKPFQGYIRSFRVCYDLKLSKYKKESLCLLSPPVL